MHPFRVDLRFRQGRTLRDFFSLTQELLNEIEACSERSHACTNGS
ncbi:unnamed protein product [Chondrus crispus]|uniref:Uncharacterized protein n=1 Tax=Chondrus crispus TaxID=2769 RepID=R7QTW5_CHOCR|nr:unnamed protein product [Chondrus crispus]CDF40815.1 unnamed protein product [Chondrus crispus]|eukprot:XP_005711109.1 unnamed protein product [Chondrus crispus]